MTITVEKKSPLVDLEFAAETISRFEASLFNRDVITPSQQVGTSLTCNTDTCEPSWDDCTGTLCATDYGC